MFASPPISESTGQASRLPKAAETEVHSEIEAFFDLGEDTLLVYYLLRGRGRESGAEGALPAAAVVRTRDGLIVYLEATLIEDAFRDLGLSETELDEVRTPSRR